MTTDHSFYFDRLYPLQDRVLAAIDQLGTAFYLTGGTATSRGYLQHRFSDDLDLFVNDDPQFGLWTERIITALGGLEGTLAIGLRDQRFVRVSFRHQDVDLKIEMVSDVPARVGTAYHHPTLGQLDTAENILANKLTALLGRQEPKDLADVWGLCTRHGLSLSPALEGAQGKAVGLFAPDVARVLLGATSDDWALVRWITAPDADQFVAELQQLGENLLLHP